MSTSSREPLALAKLAGLGDVVELLNLLAVDGALADHHLEAVVIARVVAGGDHHAAVGRKVEHRKIEHRGGHHADVHDVAAGGQQTLAEQVAVAVGAQAAVAAQSDALDPLPGHVGADGLAQGDHVGVVDVLVHHATDVVFAEYAGVHDLPLSSRCLGLGQPVGPRRPGLIKHHLVRGGHLGRGQTGGQAASTGPVAAFPGARRPPESSRRPFPRSTHSRLGPWPGRSRGPLFMMTYLSRPKESVSTRELTSQGKGGQGPGVQGTCPGRSELQGLQGA